MKRFTSLILLLAFSHPSLAAQLPSSFSAVYSMQKYGATVIEMTLTLNQVNNNISYESHSRALGMLSMFSDDRVDEISQLQWDNEVQHARLQNYQFTRKKKKRKNQKFSLSWNKQNDVTIKGTYGGNKFDIYTHDLIWDRLSVQLALAADLKSTDKVKETYSYNIVDKGKIKQYQFEYVKDELVHLDDRQYNTIKLKRAHASGKRTTYLWLARELDFLPVKIDQYREGVLHMNIELDKFTLKP